MIRKYILPFIAFLGISFSIFMIFWSRRTPPAPPILFNPPTSPYTHYVAGEGIVESRDENIKIATAYPDLIADVFVQVGDYVKKGAPLFKIDTRQQEADLKRAAQEVELAVTNYKNLKTQYHYFQQLDDKAAVSKQDYTQAYYAYLEAKDRVQVAIAALQQIKIRIERSFSVAPCDGQVLQANARIGEFANVNPFDRIPIMIFGNTELLQIRINIAEEDAWRVVPDSPATGFVRGNASIQVPLKFDYIEPYIVPKQVLTGSDVERVDTRVLQLVYTFNPNDLPIYVGQLLDVYVEAKPSKP